jgi:hypothetical protein
VRSTSTTGLNGSANRALGFASNRGGSVYGQPQRHKRRAPDAASVSIGILTQLHNRAVKDPPQHYGQPAGRIAALGVGRGADHLGCEPQGRADPRLAVRARGVDFDDGQPSLIAATQPGRLAAQDPRLDPQPAGSLAGTPLLHLARLGAGVVIWNGAAHVGLRFGLEGGSVRFVAGNPWRGLVRGDSRRSGFAPS